MVGPVVLGHVVVVGPVLVVAPVLVAVPDEVTVVAATVVRNGTADVVAVVGSTRADDETTGGTVVPVTTVTGAGPGEVVTGAGPGEVETGAAPAYPIRFPDSRPPTAITMTIATKSSTVASRRCGSRLLRIDPIQVSPRARMRNGQQRGRAPTAPHLPDPPARSRLGRERREQYRPLPAPMPSNTMPERATTCTFSS
ncbi:hypothetical protein [Nocardia pseudovaccinii]|uniref:hypothetical protein n=1 Tax=Nocardia pseudovaccinii TaxID=189540 RepID=UPI0007A5253C|nr:hypothetical protein [Nocardia pseudovaccinii]